MNLSKKTALLFAAIFFLCINISALFAQDLKPRFHVIAFYTARNDQAHISFVHEANKWFPEMAEKYNFTYDSTKDWSKLNAEFLAK